jgi:tetratricopeptide (TPR) repeat protein
MTAEPLRTRGASANPFPGLRPFEFDESHLFFGRDGQSEQLISKLSRTRFLAVVGASGGGKSSLVRAGLLPTLLGGFMTGASSDWRIAIMRPGNYPIRNLGSALSAPGVFGSEIEENAAIQTAVAEAALRRGSLGLVDIVRQAAMPVSDNLLVIVDQFEELFRFARVSEGETYRNEAAAFVKLILEATGQREIPIYVVLTMRSDYLGDCSQFWDLPEAINESQYLTPRLTRDQLREAITGPAAVGGGDITPRLVSRLLNDVGDSQDQLPILQHALMRSWDSWKLKNHDHDKQPEGDALDLCCYHSIGGMAEALSWHADEAFNELPGDLSRKVAEKLFKCLTEKGPDNREVRRPTNLSEIRAVSGTTETEVVTVIETFRQPGRSFLMPPAVVGLNSESLIDISHESLIRGWQRLREWVDEEARSARIYQRLADTAMLYKKGEEGLLRDPGLQAPLNWRDETKPNKVWAKRYHPGFDAAMELLAESEAVRNSEIAERDRKRRSVIRRTRLAATIFALLFVVALIVLAIANQQTAKLGQQLAEEEKKRLSAEELYDVGRSYLSHGTMESLNKAIKYFDDAISLKPDYTQAFAGLADCYNRLATYGAIPPAEAFPKAKAEALKALKIDNRLAEGHASLAYALFKGDWNWAEAEKEFRQALQLDPTSAQAHQRFATLLVALGRFDEAIANAERARELDPLSLIVRSQFGSIYFFAHRFDDSIAASRGALEVDPNFIVGRRNLGLAYAQKRKLDQAISEFQRVDEMGGGSTFARAELAYTYGLAGMKEAAQKILGDLQSKRAAVYVSAYNFALVYSGLGDKEETFKWLERAVEERAENLVYLRVDPRFDWLHNDARFASLLKRIGLV